MIWGVSWKCQRLIFSGSSNTDSCIRPLTDWQNNPMDVPCSKHKGKHFHATYLFFTQAHNASSLSYCFFAPTPSILPGNPEICLLFIFFSFIRPTLKVFFLEVKHNMFIQNIVTLFYSVHEIAVTVCMWENPFESFIYIK